MPHHVENMNLICEYLDPFEKVDGNQNIKIVGTAQAYIFDGQNQAEIPFYITQETLQANIWSSEIVLGREAIHKWQKTALDPSKTPLNVIIADNKIFLEINGKLITLTLKLNWKNY